MWLNELRQRWLGQTRTSPRHRRSMQRPKARRLSMEFLEHRTLLTVTVPTLSPPTLPADTVNVSYIPQTITASGGTGTVKLTVSVTHAITGLKVPTSGTGSLVISGTPTVVGTETFTVTATDSAGKATANYSILVNPAVSLSPTMLPACTLGLNAEGVPVPYNQTITASGGTGMVNLAVTNVQNPLGLTLTGGSGSLLISGPPTAAGTETFTVTATDSLGAQAIANYSITVNPAVTLTATTLPADTVSAPYSQTITTSGGTGAVTLAVSNLTNSIPGLTVPASGTGSLVISGTPTAPGMETFMVTATDSLGATTTATYGVTVNSVPVISTSSPAYAGSVSDLIGDILAANAEAAAAILAGDGPQSYTIDLAASARQPFDRPLDLPELCTERREQQCCLRSDGLACHC